MEPPMRKASGLFVSKLAAAAAATILLTAPALADALHAELGKP